MLDEEFVVLSSIVVSISACQYKQRGRPGFNSLLGRCTSFLLFICVKL